MAVFIRPTPFSDLRQDQRREYRAVSRPGRFPGRFIDAQAVSRYPPAS
jgi:hypothetical protein